MPLNCESRARATLKKISSSWAIFIRASKAIAALQNSSALFLSFPPTVPLSPVFNLRLRDRLPLHVRRSIGAATLQRNDVINDVTLLAFGIAALFHEVLPSCGTSLDLALAVSRRHRRFLRNSRRLRLLRDRR